MKFEITLLNFAEFRSVFKYLNQYRSKIRRRTYSFLAMKSCLVNIISFYTLWKTAIQSKGFCGSVVIWWGSFAMVLSLILDHNFPVVCRHRCCRRKLFTFSSSPESLGQFQPTLALGLREFKWRTSHFSRGIKIFFFRTTGLIPIKHDKKHICV